MLIIYQRLLRHYFDPIPTRTEKVDDSAVAPVRTARRERTFQLTFSRRLYIEQGRFRTPAARRLPSHGKVRL